MIPAMIVLALVAPVATALALLLVRDEAERETPEPLSPAQRAFERARSQETPTEYREGVKW